MNITSQLEKLISHRDRGDLSQEEFEKAKALLLSETHRKGPPPLKPDPEALVGKRKKRKIQLWTGILSVVAAVLSSVSLMINPNPLKLIVVFLWIVASIFNWVAFSKTKAAIEREEAEGP